MDKPKVLVSREIANEIDQKLLTDLNITRSEKMLVLPYNTLRVFDMFVQADINRAKDPNWKGDFMTLLRQVITRSEKDLGKMNGIDSEIIKKMMNDSWMHYYEMSPRTNFYAMIETLQQQSFMSDCIALFHKKNCKDDMLTNAYYDGTIEGLEKFINDNTITAICMDDVELLMTLINRGNINLNWKTIFISKIGYNYYRSKHGELMMKHANEWCDKYALEVATLDLVNF